MVNTTTYLLNYQCKYLSFKDIVRFYIFGWSALSWTISQNAKSQNGWLAFTLVAGKTCSL